jgi:ATP-dependent Zn protease
MPKREAAYHEAGHAVAADKSRFHALVGPINLANYGAGAIDISLSKSKLRAAGKRPVADSQRDQDVARDFAKILTAGLVAEQIASEKDKTLKPHPECAVPDHQLLKQNLNAAGLSKKFDRFEAESRRVLESNWNTVEKLARYLMEKEHATVDEIREIIDDATEDPVC